MADGLLDAYENKLRRPSRTVYVLDTSGSMREDGRLDRLKKALTDLTGDFRDREEVTLMPFGSAVKSVRTHVVRPENPRSGLDGIRRDTEALTADGDTAIYTSLEKAYEHLGADDDTFTSIVLMTDGENTAGRALRSSTASTAVCRRPNGRSRSSRSSSETPTGASWNTSPS